VLCIWASYGAGVLHSSSSSSRGNSNSSSGNSNSSKTHRGRAMVLASCIAAAAVVCSCMLSYNISASVSFPLDSTVLYVAAAAAMAVAVAIARATAQHRQWQVWPCFAAAWWCHAQPTQLVFWLVDHINKQHQLLLPLRGVSVGVTVGATLLVLVQLLRRVAVG